jgi:hypothetical protein
MKNNQWQETITESTSTKVYVAVAPTETNTKKAKKTEKETLSILGRRFSFDDNGGGYRGL